MESARAHGSSLYSFCFLGDNDEELLTRQQLAKRAREEAQRLSGQDRALRLANLINLLSPQLHAAGLDHLRVNFLLSNDGEMGTHIFHERKIVEVKNPRITSCCKAIVFKRLPEETQTPAANVLDEKALKRAFFSLSLASAKMFGVTVVKNDRSFLADNVFANGAYACYLRQMKAYVFSLRDKYPQLFTDGRAENLCASLVRHILQIDETNLAVHRAAHEKTLTSLRFILQSTRDENFPFIDDLIYWMFTQPSLEEAWIANLSFMTCSLAIDPPCDIFHEIKRVSDGFWDQNHGGWADSKDDSDSHFTGNLISKIEAFRIHHGAKVSQFIRMANVGYLKDNLESGAYKVMPEFLQCLEAFEKRGLSMLIVNLMWTKMWNTTREM